MTDPRQRRAALIRDQVLMQLEQGPAPTHLVLYMVRKGMIGDVSGRQVESALQQLRREGKARYHERRWELV